MGIKSTTCLTRDQAERLAVDRISDNVSSFIRKMSDTALESFLGIDQDFDNYMIVENEEMSDL